MSVQELKRYWKLFLSFAKANLVLNLEYRTNMITNFITDIGWYCGSIGVFETIFAHTSQVGGWNLDQVRVFMGVTFIVDYFFMLFVYEGIDYLNQSIANGEIDLLLTKPIESQFILAFRKMGLSFMGSGAVAISYFFWAYIQWLKSAHGADSIYMVISYLPLLWLFLLIPSALITIYVFRFLIASSAVFFTKAENLQFLWVQVYRLGLRPDSIFPNTVRWIFLTILPISLSANIPTQVILNKYPEYTLLLAFWGIVWSLGLLKISNVYWKFCMKKYSSSSS